jgi:hypothetical protein
MKTIFVKQMSLQRNLRYLETWNINGPKHSRLIELSYEHLDDDFTLVHVSSVLGAGTFLAFCSVNWRHAGMS